MKAKRWLTVIFGILILFVVAIFLVTISYSSTVSCMGDMQAYVYNGYPEGHPVTISYSTQTIFYSSYFTTTGNYNRVDSIHSTTMQFTTTVSNDTETGYFNGTCTNVR